MWVGGVADSQTRSKPLKTPPQITPKIALFDPNFTFRSPKSHKNTGVGGKTDLGDISQKKRFFLPSLKGRPFQVGAPSIWALPK